LAVGICACPFHPRHNQGSAAGSITSCPD